MGGLNVISTACGESHSTSHFHRPRMTSTGYIPVSMWQLAEEKCTRGGVGTGSVYARSPPTPKEAQGHSRGEAALILHV